MIEQAAHVLRPMPIAHPIKAREVGRSFRRGQNVVNTDGVVRVRKRNLDDFRAEFA